MEKVSYTEYLESYAEFEKAVTSSKESAIDFLKSIGFLDKDGNIRDLNGNGEKRKQKERNGKK